MCNSSYREKDRILKESTWLLIKQTLPSLDEDNNNWRLDYGVLTLFDQNVSYFADKLEEEGFLLEHCFILKENGTIPKEPKYRWYEIKKIPTLVAKT